MVSHRDGVIAELREEACTLWASGWLAFRRKAAKAFPGFDFIFKFLMTRRRKNPFQRTRQIPGCSRIPPSLLLFLVKWRFLLRLALPSHPLGLRLLTCTA